MEFRFRACDVERTRPSVLPPVVSVAVEEDVLLMEERLRAEIRKEVVAELLMMHQGNTYVETLLASQLGDSSVESPQLVEIEPPALTTSGSKRKQPSDVMIAITSKKSMEEHLNVKNHTKKEVLSDATSNGELPEAAVDSHKPRKLIFQTCHGTMHYVLQMDGYLLCELCNARATDRVTMMCHLQGGKHISKVRTLHRDVTAADAEGKRSTATVSSSTDAHNADVIEIEGVAHSMLPMHAAGSVVNETRSVEPLQLVQVEPPSSLALASEPKWPNDATQAMTTSSKQRHDEPQTLTALRSKRKHSDDAMPAISGTTGSKKHHIEQPKCITKTSENDVLEQTGSGWSAMMMAAHSHKQTKLTMQTLDGTMHGVLQTGGHLLCEPCKDRADDCVTMMCHPQRGKRISKIKSLCPGEAPTETKQEGVMPMAASIHAPELLIAMEVNGTAHTVMKMPGYLFCDRCNVRADSECIMRAHLGGKKHKSKIKAVATIGSVVKAVKEMDMAQPKAIGTSKNKSSSAAGADKSAQSLGEVEFMATARTDASPKTTMEVQKRIALPWALEKLVKATDVPSTGDTDMLVDEAAKMGKIAGKTMKFLIEGIVYDVVEAENGVLICASCGVHRRDTYGMALHLYTDMHRREFK